MDIEKLYADRVEAAKAVRKLADVANDEGRDFTAEEQEQWDKSNADYDRLTNQIKIAERAEQIHAQQESVNRKIVASDVVAHEPEADGPRLGDADIAVRAWAKTQGGIVISDEDAAACQRVGVNPQRKDIVIDLSNTQTLRAKALAMRSGKHFSEERALSVGTVTAGGYMVPTGFVQNLEQALLAFGGMLQISDVIVTDTGDALHWPKVNDTGNSGALLAENATVTEQDVTFGEIIFNAYKYTSKLVRVSQELIEDSAFDINTLLGSLLGERLGRALNTATTTGTGSSQPNGVVTASALGVTGAAGTGTAVSGDNLIDLLHSVDPAYRQNAMFMMNDATAGIVRKLKDSNGQYLWGFGLNGGIQDTILGKPVSINQDMADVAVNNKAVLFGDFSKYKIRQVRGLRLRRMVERYADSDQDGFVAFLRFDGDLLEGGTNPVKHLLQAAT